MCHCFSTGALQGQRCDLFDAPHLWIIQEYSEQLAMDRPKRGPDSQETYLLYCRGQLHVEHSKHTITTHRVLRTCIELSPIQVPYVFPFIWSEEAGGKTLFWLLCRWRNRLLKETFSRIWNYCTKVPGHGARASHSPCCLLSTLPVSKPAQTPYAQTGEGLLNIRGIRCQVDSSGIQTALVCKNP